MPFNGELLEIFSWLPAEVIYKFLSTCKACDKLLSEYFFIEKQYQNMQLKGDYGFFVQPDSVQRYKDTLELHSLSGNDSIIGMPCESLEFLTDTCRVLGSNNGLVCGRNLSYKPPELFICNPVTRRWLPIPVPKSLADTDMDLNIVFECNNADFMLMAIEAPKDWSSPSEFKIHSYKKGTWKDMGQIVTGARNIQFKMPVCYNGTLNFISDWSPYLSKNSPFYWPYIVSYDLKNGTSRFLPIPKGARKDLHDNSCKLGIFKWVKAASTSICLIKLHKTTFSVWVMLSTDNNSSSWKRIMKIRVGAMGIRESNLSVAGFTVLNGSSLLIATATKVYIYDLLTNERKRHGGMAKELCEHGCGTTVLFNSYSSTLRPCEDGTSPLPI